MGAKFPNLESVTGAFNGSIAVDVDDLVYQESDDFRPFSSQADQLTEAANQARVAPLFVGVSKERKLLADGAGTLDVCPEWIGDITCVSATWEIGDLVAPKEDSGGTFLEDQKVVKTTDPNLAIGYCIKREASATTTVRVRLISRLLKNQPNSPSAPVNGVATGYKVARGRHTTVAAADTVVTGLTTVVAVVASFETDPADANFLVSATIGDQAGTPAAGSIIIKTWKHDGTDPTPAAATTFSKVVNWIAIGT